MEDKILSTRIIGKKQANLSKEVSDNWEVKSSDKALHAQLQQFQKTVCNDCHDLQILYINITNITIFTVILINEKN